MERHNDSVRITAVPFSHFARINTNYDVDEALPKPRKQWWKDARCKDVPIEDRDAIFFPKPGGNNPYKVAKTYCLLCPVRQDCLYDSIAEEAGIGRRDMIGMRGGKTPGQRWEIYKELRADGLVRRRTNSEAVKRLGRFEHHSQYKPEHGAKRAEQNKQKDTE